MNIGSDFLFALVIWGLGVATGLMLGSPPSSTQHRAETRVVHDSGTGCQYLSGHSGSLITRLDANGQQVCRHE